MSSREVQGGGGIHPWFADQDVIALIYRINRRPRSNQQTLIPLPDFIDHVTECLLFGESIITGRRFQREWRLGNRKINETAGTISGLIGWITPGAAEEAIHYNSDANEWVAQLEERSRAATAPFAVIATSQQLFVLKHPSFKEQVIPAVFEGLLNLGENARQFPSTMWAVEPILDPVDWERWLADTPVLDKVVFTVKQPNPDAAESFAQINAHLIAMEASELKHELTPRDPERGLSKDFESEPIAQGLMEMARRAYATIRAVGRSAGNQVRKFNQRERVRRTQLRMPPTYDDAQEALAQQAAALNESGPSDAE